MNRRAFLRGLGALTVCAAAGLGFRVLSPKRESYWQDPDNLLPVDTALHDRLTEALEAQAFDGLRIVQWNPDTKTAVWWTPEQVRQYLDGERRRRELSP